MALACGRHMLCALAEHRRARRLATLGRGRLLDRDVTEDLEQWRPRRRRACHWGLSRLRRALRRALGAARRHPTAVARCVQPRRLTQALPQNAARGTFSRGKDRGEPGDDVFTHTRSNEALSAGATSALSQVQRTTRLDRASERHDVRDTWAHGKCRYGCSRSQAAAFSRLASTESRWPHFCISRYYRVASCGSLSNPWRPSALAQPSM